MENSVLLVRIYLPKIPRVPTTRPSREKKSISSRTCIIHSHSFFPSRSLPLSLFFFSHSSSYPFSLSLSLSLSLLLLGQERFFFFTSGSFPANEKNGILAEFLTLKDVFAYPFFRQRTLVAGSFPENL